MFDSGEYADDPEVEVLARAVEGFTNATAQAVSLPFNITNAFPWAYASVVVPDFFCTAIKPEPNPEIQSDGTVSWHGCFYEDCSWYLQYFQKFSASLYRSKFRTGEDLNWHEIMLGSASPVDIAPTAFQALSYTRRYDCVHPTEESNSTTPVCGSKTLSPTSIVASFNNATLSFWLEGETRAKGSVWTP